jgi:hypothetical protein
MELATLAKLILNPVMEGDPCGLGLGREIQHGWGQPAVIVKPKSRMPRIGHVRICGGPRRITAPAYPTSRTVGLPKFVAHPSSPSSPFIAFIPGQLSPRWVGAAGPASGEISGDMYLLF